MKTGFLLSVSIRVHPWLERDSRDLRRFGRILIEYNSALRWALKPYEETTPALLPKALLSRGRVAINSPCPPLNLLALTSSLPCCWPCSRPVRALKQTR